MNHLKRIAESIQADVECHKFKFTPHRIFLHALEQQKFFQGMGIQLRCDREYKDDVNYKSNLNA